MILKWNDKPKEIIRTSTGWISPIAAHNFRVPGGHPEGYIEAFANIYRNFALALQCIINGEKPKPEYLDFPGAEDGLKGMQFIETVVTSSASDTKWIKIVK